VESSSSSSGASLAPAAFTAAREDARYRRCQVPAADGAFVRLSSASAAAQDECVSVAAARARAWIEAMSDNDLRPDEFLLSGDVLITNAPACNTN
jgi:hypothetical protein